MEPTFVYTRKRIEFGKQNFFTDDGSVLLEDLKPNKKEFEDYILKNPVSRETQRSFIQAEHEVRPVKAVLISKKN